MLNVLKTFTNPDKNKVKEIVQALKDNDGYCPCSLVKSINTLCQCRAFRRKQTEGYCHCGLYYKKEVPDGEKEQQQ